MVGMGMGMGMASHGHGGTVTPDSPGGLGGPDGSCRHFLNQHTLQILEPLIQNHKNRIGEADVSCLETGQPHRF